MASTDIHHNQALEAHLRSLLAVGDWNKVLTHLDTLSHSQYRTAGYILGERLMKELPDLDFWSLADALISHSPKAFLTTVLKSAAERGFDIGGEGFAKVCGTLRGNAVDVDKTLKFLLPTLDKPELILSLFSSLNVVSPDERLPHLIRVQTPAAAYVLLLTLKSFDHNRTLLLRVVRYLMKRGGDKSFNLASLLKTYFGLEEVKGTFSREIEPYQLARLDSSYEAFCDMLNK